MSQQENTVQPTSQATGFSEDFIKIFEGLLSGGALGTGAPGLQRESGTAIRQFVESGGFTPAIELGVERGIGQVREGQGARGTRFGTPDVREEGRIVEGSAAAASQNLLNAIGLMSQIGTANLAPFLALAGQGIFPTQTVFTENPAVSIVKGITGGAGAAAPFFSGGGGGQTTSGGNNPVNPFLNN